MEEEDDGETDDESEVQDKAKLSKYSLTGVICHTGKTLLDGHYYAYVRRRKDDGHSWYKCSDTTVREVNGNMAKKLKSYLGKPSKRLYMLMYSRNSTLSKLPQSKPPKLQNFGNTCFANAAMQVLMTLPNVAKISAHKGPAQKFRENFDETEEKVQKKCKFVGAKFNQL